MEVRDMQPSVERMRAAIFSVCKLGQCMLLATRLRIEFRCNM